MKISSITSFAFWLALILPVAIYLLSVLKKRALARSGSQQFFLAKSSLSHFEFSNSSIAYGFQIASISVFLVWGYTFGLAALVNPIFWGLGIFAFATLINRVLATLRDGETIHGFLSRHYDSRLLGTLGAVMTMLGYLGAITAELSIGSTVLSVIIADKYAIAAVVTVLALGIATYIWLVGQHAALQTDELQLGFSYLGFISLSVALTWLAIRVTPAEAGVTTAAILLFILLLGMMIAVWKQTGGLRGIWTSNEYTIYSGERAVALLIACMVLIGAILAAATVIAALTASQSSGAAIKQVPLFDFSQGWVNLLSLALLPLFWQFIDIPMWQRLAAVKTLGENQEERAREIRKGLLRFAFESPATWILAIIVGISLRYIDIGVSSENIWSVFGEFPFLLVQANTQLSIMGAILGVVFFLAVVATMLSTADSMLMSSIFVASRDLAKQGQARPRPSIEQDISLARLTSYIVIFCSIGIIWAQVLLELDIVSILMGAYSAQLSLAPAVLGMLLLGPRKATEMWALASLIGGFCLSSFATANALMNQSWQLYPPLFALGASFSIYIVGVAMTTGKKPSKS